MSNSYVRGARAISESPDEGAPAPASPSRASVEGASDPREDLHIDITAAMPFLSACTILPEAMVRYRAVFESNDADADGLLNVNQLHVALSVVNNHEIRWVVLP